MPPKKKFYTDLSSVLILLSTFAGAVTLSTQFTAPDNCSHSRARLLLAYSSQFFLACPIGLFTIFMCLHGLDDNAVIEPGRHFFVRCQFAFVGLMLIAGFLLLNISISYTGAGLLGPAGATMTGLFVASTVLWSVEAHMPRRVYDHQHHHDRIPDRNGGDDGGGGGGGGGGFTGSTEEVGKDTIRGFLGVGNGERGGSETSTRVPGATRALRWLIFLVLGLEFVGILVLLALGITQATRVSSPGGCQLL